MFNYPVRARDLAGQTKRSRSGFRHSTPTTPSDLDFLKPSSCACGGNCPRCSANLPIQAKLSISEPGDKYEREADRVANQVMRMTDSDINKNTSAQTPIQIQRSVNIKNTQNNKVPAIVPKVLSKPGQPLDITTRNFFESRFGHNFNHVRLHFNNEATESARAINARAYTVGNHIVLDNNEYKRNSDIGTRLLAHELTHVIQQQPPSSKNTNVAERHGQAIQLSGSDSVLQRSSKSNECNWDNLDFSCANIEQCLLPDRQLEGWQGPVESSSWWRLTVVIDIEARTAGEISTGGNWGHTYLEFRESNGDSYTYGFYPGESPGLNPVSGCIAHPDKVHEPCSDHREEFDLTKQEYGHALANVMDKCRNTPKYDPYNYNCTTFADEAVTDAGKSLPPLRGEVTWMDIPADNPNTLLEGLQERDEMAK